jgi:hypothetical protein
VAEAVECMADKHEWFLAEGKGTWREPGMEEL